MTGKEPNPRKSSKTAASGKGKGTRKTKGKAIAASGAADAASSATATQKTSGQLSGTLGYHMIMFRWNDIDTYPPPWYDIQTLSRP